MDLCILMTTDLPFLNIYNPFTNERIKGYLRHKGVGNHRHLGYFVLLSHCVT